MRGTIYLLFPSSLSTTRSQDQSCPNEAGPHFRTNLSKGPRSLRLYSPLSSPPHLTLARTIFLLYRIYAVEKGRIFSFPGEGTVPFPPPVEEVLFKRSTSTLTPMCSLPPLKHKKSCTRPPLSLCLFLFLRPLHLLALWPPHPPRRTRPE